MWRCASGRLVVVTDYQFREFAPKSRKSQCIRRIARLSRPKRDILLEGSLNLRPASGPLNFNPSPGASGARFFLPNALFQHAVHQPVELAPLRLGEVVFLTHRSSRLRRGFHCLASRLLSPRLLPPRPRRLPPDLPPLLRSQRLRPRAAPGSPALPRKLDALLRRPPLHGGATAQLAESHRSRIFFPSHLNILALCQTQF